MTESKLRRVSVPARVQCVHVRCIIIVVFVIVNIEAHIMGRFFFKLFFWLLFTCTVIMDRLSLNDRFLYVTKWSLFVSGPYCMHLTRINGWKNIYIRDT